MTVIRDYRCEQCGSEYPLMVGVPLERVVGGIDTYGFAPHGPDLKCTGQVFNIIRKAPLEVSK